MEKFTTNIKSIFWKVFPVFCILFIVSCGGDDEDPGGSTGDDPIASFQSEIDPDNFLQVNLENFSQNATTYDWDFGDGNSSADKDPSHIYDSAGTYVIKLTASNDAGASAERSETIMITDPNEALKLLTGEDSKTWKLFREGISMSLWSDPALTSNFWPGLSNDGSRPCLYEAEVTFHLDGTYEYDDKGMFWAEFGVFNNVDGCDNNTDEQCFDAVAANMVNACGEDVSAWLSGSHTFEYDPSAGDLSLSGMGAWIGLPKLTTNGETRIPVSATNAKVSIEEFTGYDVLKVEFIYDGTYWPIYYASYSDASLEPALVTEAVPFGVDLPDASPTSLSHSFMEAGTSNIDTILSGSFIEFGIEDPADATATCGMFIRTAAQFQELQIQTTPEKNDINFENMTSVSIDVYLPSTNDYSGGLNQTVIIGLADRSNTEQWWTDHQQFESDPALPNDEWVTVTFDLSTPSFVANDANGATPFDRNDYDMIFLNIGGSDHTDEGTFYVRNLIFE